MRAGYVRRMAGKGLFICIVVLTNEQALNTLEIDGDVQGFDGVCHFPRGVTPSKDVLLGVCADVLQ